MIIHSSNHYEYFMISLKQQQSYDPYIILISLCRDINTEQKREGGGVMTLPNNNNFMLTFMTFLCEMGLLKMKEK